MKLFISNGNIDEDLIRDFRLWFEDGGHVAEKYKALEKLYAEHMGFDENPSREVAESFAEICRKLGLPVPSKFGRSERKMRRLDGGKMLRIAAVVVPLAIVFTSVGVIVFRNGNTPAPDKMSSVLPATQKADTAQTSVGMQDHAGKEIVQVVADDVRKNMSLPDSSSIWINRNSTLEYNTDFNNNRIVALNGEAFFDVRKKGGRSFTVQTDDLQTTVTGTSFNVQSYPKASTIVISLYEGSLEVEHSGRKYHLSAGQELEYNKVNYQVDIAPIQGFMPEWLNAVAGFEQTRADEILAKLQKIYGIPIIVEDPTLTDELITVHFEQSIPLNRLMFIISQLSNKFTYEYDSDNKSVHIVAK